MLCLVKKIMSRIGRLPIILPDGVSVNKELENIIVKGPKGELSMPLSNQVGIDINTNDNIIILDRLPSLATSPGTRA